MTRLAFISDGRINILDTDGKPKSLECIVADKYRQREREIRNRNEWKNSGAGAMFTGNYQFEDEQEARKLPVAGLSNGIDERLVFSVNYEVSGGIYFKHSDGFETPILVSQKVKFFEIDVNKNGYIAASSAEPTSQRHICVFKIDDTYPQDVTEGDCVDYNPKWSLKDENILYYDSAGIGYDTNGFVAGYGPRSIYRLNIKTGELDEVLEGDKYEYTNPFEDIEGNLYYIRKPYKLGKDRMSAKDLAKAPGKLARAVGGWLDLFTRRYSGEKLKTSGANPAKHIQKSAEQMFVDGNLFEAEKAMKENTAAGDKNPGYIPRDWELVKRDFKGVETVLQRSVMSYFVTDSGIIYSNGKYIVGDDNAIKAHLATKLIGGA
ncbi:MAG: hypothetical protein FWE33_06805 [Defluviitaleaceae bacterium]|nr:hypothetical protein [Defluviitaleaceae bacterium]